MTTAHTPTPWHSYEKSGVPTEVLVRWRVGNPRFCIAGIALSGDSRIDEANAAHIVACVNAHDALVARVAELEAALREAVKVICTYQDGTPGQIAASATVTKARAALAKGQS